MPEFYLTVEQAAERLQVHPVTLRRYLQTGVVRGVKRGRLWRIPESATGEATLPPAAENEHPGGESTQELTPELPHPTNPIEPKRPHQRANADRAGATAVRAARDPRPIEKDVQPIMSNSATTHEKSRDAFASSQVAPATIPPANSLQPISERDADALYRTYYHAFRTWATSRPEAAFWRITFEKSVFTEQRAAEFGRLFGDFLLESKCLGHWQHFELDIVGVVACGMRKY